ncbi:hypothetical protein V8B97DRAFT_2005261 [Scleroderma yunnanense]
MADEDIGKSKMKWNDVEITALVNSLYECHAQQANSGNFKDPVYSVVTQEIAYHHTPGTPMKTA